MKLYTVHMISLVWHYFYLPMLSIVRLTIKSVQSSKYTACLLSLNPVSSNELTGRRVVKKSVSAFPVKWEDNEASEAK